MNAEKFFLYIDILGFSTLVQENKAKVDDLYEVITSLNVHRNGYFKAIVFSDTILVYNTVEPSGNKDCRVMVMYLCEFAKDLQQRLAGREIVYRAIITVGEFYHYQINEVPCFYGQALIDTYNSEKKIKATGLFINRMCAHYCDIFDFVEYDEQYMYVFVTQNMNVLEDEYHGLFPINDYIVEQTDLAWHVMPEITTLQNVYRNTQHPVKKVRAKYRKTLTLYKKRYPKTMGALIKNDFKPNFISPSYDWQKVIERYPEDYSYIKGR